MAYGLKAYSCNPLNKSYLFECVFDLISLQSLLMLFNGINTFFDVIEEFIQ